MTTITTNSPHQMRRRLGLAVCGTMLALATSLGTWQIARHERTDSPSSPAGTTTAVTMTDRGPVIYLVSSAEEAEYLRGFHASIENVRAATGQRSVPAKVLVTDLAGAEIAASLPHAPGTALFDLRVP